MDAYFDIFGDNTTFHAYGMHTDVNGNMWALASRLSTTADNADQVDYSSFSVMKGVFNTGTNSVDWTVASALPWSVFTYNGRSMVLPTGANSWNIGLRTRWTDRLCRDQRNAEHHYSTSCPPALRVQNH